MLDKYSTYFTISFFALLWTINSSNFFGSIAPVSVELGVSTTKAWYLVCFNVLVIGLGNLVWVGRSRALHRQAAHIPSRIVSGFACATTDATVPAVVADLFLVHKRGHWMMIYHLASIEWWFLVGAADYGVYLFEVLVGAGHVVSLPSLMLQPLWLAHLPFENQLTAEQMSP